MNLLTTILTSAGTTGLILAVVGILGKMWADRRVERLKNELQSEMDLLTRRRDVYVHLSNAMRIFQRSDRKISDEERAERGARFLAAYDEACLWASEPVIGAVNHFLALNVIDERSGKTQGSDAQKKEAYAACMKEMRKDCGFSDTSFEYRVVSFD